MKNDILEELRSVSEFVATISRETTYRVADDYFTDLCERVLIRVKTNHKPLVFNVPDGFFESFAAGVLAKIKAEAGVPVGFAPSNPLPETAGQELSGLSPLLAQLRSKETYRMPEGYLEEVSPILAIAKELNPYTVPEEYFHQLPVGIEEKVAESREEEAGLVKKPAKVVAFGGRRTRLWQYSAAAVVAGLILTIGWLRLQVTGGTHPVKPAENVVVSLPKVSDQELQSFLADTHVDDDTPVEQSAANIAALDFNDGEVNSLLADIPDGDLKQYMDEHGGAVDIATN
ncbi:MAG TPA: hypothetical protein VHE34_27615 [Puia sp.]|uniref:hypothetical protein n=1 Tax=Puia sp. TaxID=2045100 RepID=UPI002BF35DDE|nr:hypothetical protein [Puia sp.]HVU99033.1 hypothetical protein [Puia sp.]